MRVIAVANQKGGVGKTTVAINLSSCLAKTGQRTLLVDLDPQSHCAVGLAVPEDQIEMSIAEVLMPDEASRPVRIPEITWEICSRLELAPSRLDLAAFEPKMADAPDRDCRLVAALQQVKEQYDYCILDCPPHIGLLTFNALQAAEEVIIPVDTGYFAMQGLGKQIETIEHLRKQTGRNLKIRILSNMYDVRTKYAREALAELRRHFGSLMLQTFINFNTKLREASSLGQPISEYEPNSMGSKDFMKLAREVISLAEPTGSVPQALLEHADELAAKAERLLATSQALIGPSRRTEVANGASVATHEEIHSRIEQVYGARQTPEGVCFAAHAPGAQRVSVAGDFNRWSPEQHVMKAGSLAGDFELLIPLPPGRYSYRLVVDGRWQHDPANKTVETNPYGELNSVVEVC
jgi:chromosome partitioning protein